MAEDTVYFFDVDNTLLDNDRVQDDLRDHLTAQFGQEECQRYWDIFEQLRTELGYADYLGALQRYRVHHLHDPGLLEMSSYLVDYPFAERLYPQSMEVLAKFRSLGTAAILSDGDVVFQPHKVKRAGLWDALSGNVLIYIHKEHELADAAQRFPANHYVLVDDKLRILSAVKQVWGERVTTVFPRQGHYANDPAVLAGYPPADVTIDAIGELLSHDAGQLRSAARHS